MSSARLLLASLLIAGCATVPCNPTIEPGDFVAGIDNPFFPLAPGTRLIYEGATDQG